VETRPFPIEVDHNPNANVANLCRDHPCRTPLQKLGGLLAYHMGCNVPAPILSSDPSLQALFDQILA